MAARRDRPRTRRPRKPVEGQGDLFADRPPPEPVPPPRVVDVPALGSIGDLPEDELRAMGPGTPLRAGDDSVDATLYGRAVAERGEVEIAPEVTCDAPATTQTDPPPGRPPPETGPSPETGAHGASGHDEDEAKPEPPEAAQEGSSVPVFADCSHNVQTEAGHDRVCERCGEVVGRVEFPPGEAPPEPANCSHTWARRGVTAGDEVRVVSVCSECGERGACFGDHEGAGVNDGAIVYCDHCGETMRAARPVDADAVDGYEPPGEDADVPDMPDDAPPDGAGEFEGDLLF